MPETTALGAAMAAGHCIGIWSLNTEDLTTITTDTFHPQIADAGIVLSPHNSHTLPPFPPLHRFHLSPLTWMSVGQLTCQLTVNA